MRKTLLIRYGGKGNRMSGREEDKRDSGVEFVLFYLVECVNDSDIVKAPKPTLGLAAKYIYNNWLKEEKPKFSDSILNVTSLVSECLLDCGQKKTFKVIV